MPGLVGIITRMPREDAMAELLRMVDSMRHEDFYVTGVWHDESVGIYIGWVEHDLLLAAAMPLRSESGHKVLMFSGQEFSTRSDMKLSEGCRSNGGRSSYSYLVESADHDPTFPANLNGQFHGVLVDKYHRTVTLFNDRFGLHRLYYHEAKGGFYFAAEAKAILAVHTELRSPDPSALGEFVACGCVLEDRTIFKGINVLPFGSAWLFRNAESVRRDRYLAPQDFERQPIEGPAAYHNQVREVFERIVPRYLTSHERVGLSLTGGLDTRLILAYGKDLPSSMTSYTFGGTCRECRDVTIARRVAGICGLPHQVILVGSEFLSHFNHYAERTVFLTDGCAGVNYSPDLYVNELARQIAPIRMTGNYGDQVLRHMTVFRSSVPSPGLFTPDFQRDIEQAGETYAGVIHGHALTKATTVQTSWHYQGLLALEASQVAMRTPYLDNDLLRVLYRAPACTLANNDLRVQLIEDGSAKLGKIRTDLGFAGKGGTLVRGMSRQFYRLTMRAEYACENGVPRWLGNFDRGFISQQLYRGFVGRHKFAHFCLWYRNELAGYLHEVLLDPRSVSRPYLRQGTVEDLVESHVNGDANNTAMIHKLLSLELMHRQLLDPQ